jgi:SAM-dependent methyltransferase
MAFADKVAEQQSLLADLGLASRPKGLAVDLGSGLGYQSFALANLGYNKVLAIDTSRDLLDELEAENLSCVIETILADLRAFPTFIEHCSASAIVCMGDTLTHLESRSDISTLLLDAYDALMPDGHLILTFRDFSTELNGLDRFLPVRSDDDRIMTCVLDYGPENVVVTDLIYVRDDGGWMLQKSSYRKLRLLPEALVAELHEVGFIIDHNRPAGRMHAISARKG